MDERFFQRLVDEGTPSIVRPAHDPNARFYISSGDPYGQAYCHSHGLYPDETPANYPARFDREQHVLVSRPRATPDCVQEHSRQEVRRYRACLLYTSDAADE